MERGCDIPPYVYWMGFPISDIPSRIGLFREPSLLNSSRHPRGSETQYLRYWRYDTFDQFAAPPVNNSRDTRELVPVAPVATYSEGVSE